MEKKILIVDYDPDIIEATTMLLESSGYKDLSEADSDLGLESALNNKPDLIIFDNKMQEPDDGFFLIKKLRKESINTPVIIYSSVSNALGYNFGGNSLIKAGDL